MGRVFVVHCIDTEGPLNETLEATFQRIKQLSGVELVPSYDTLKKIQKGEIQMNGKEDMLKQVFSERLLAYNKDWHELDKMLDRITSDEYRMLHHDSEGKPWKYTWFVMDHIDYDSNPRNKITGYNAIWDHYQEYYRLHNIYKDEFQWHVHPANVYRQGNKCASSYWNSPHVIRSLAHRLIDRGFFPIAFRPGYHTERPDSHWLLEQYIPYDYSNQAVEQTKEESLQFDLADGRWGDWRRAPDDWSWYHPSHDDYQVPGACRRTIFRCLNIGTRIRLLSQTEIDKAFREAQLNKDIIVAFCDHDFRDMSYDIDDVYNMLNNAEKKYPNVKWISTTAADAAKTVLKMSCEPIIINTEIKKTTDKSMTLIVNTNIESFGPQPFFAIKLRCGEYLYDNMDVQVPNRTWTYTFDEENIRPDDIVSVGLATNSKCGSGNLKVITLDGQVLYDNKW